MNAVSSASRVEEVQTGVDSLPLFDVNIEVADHDSGPISTDAFLTSAEFPTPCKLQNIHTVFRSNDTRTLHRNRQHHIGTPDSLTGRVVHKHFATVAFPPLIKCAYGEICWNKWLLPYLWTKLDHVVVSFHKRNHSQKHRIL